MLFNSLEFVLFLPLVFLLYWQIASRSLRLRNAFLILASYVFYGWWDWRFLSLIVISSLADFVIGQQVEGAAEPKKRKLWLLLSLGINLSILGFFKYYNFFIQSFTEGLETLGLQANPTTLKIALPVGISFYTFQTLSYTVDIYRRQIQPTQDPIAFFAFVSFFPQLVAGPIERAKNLLPQILKPKDFDATLATDGVRQILWGFFKKIVIADQCALQADYIFANHGELPAIQLWLGVFYFAFQIYGDFSGYSDIAIGTAKLFGFQLMQNFRMPYFSSSVVDFWHRWHISLSTWFRDYVYIPLGGSRTGKLGRIRNIILTFTISGFWHGANWTYIAWGFVNGLFYLPVILFQGVRPERTEAEVFRKLKKVVSIAFVFLMISLTWVLFRSKTIDHAFDYYAGLFAGDLMVFPSSRRQVLVWVGILVLIEFFTRSVEHPFQKLSSWPRLLRWGVYLVFCLLIFKFFTVQRTFIYFQF